MRISVAGKLSDIRIGSISSDVDRTIATSVPTVITLPVKRFAAAAEKPHCGIAPTSAPGIGPSTPARFIMLAVFSDALCSINSIRR